MESNKKNLVRIAIPTNDGKNIFKGMLGRAKEFFIYEIGNGEQFRFIEKRNNPYSNTMQRLKTLDVYELLSDCKIIISHNIGKKGVERLIRKGMKIFFKKGNIREALIDIIKEK